MDSEDVSRELIETELGILNLWQRLTTCIVRLSLYNAILLRVT